MPRRANPLYVLLPLFLLTGLLLLFREMYTGSTLSHVGPGAVHAYSPGDFPEVFDFDPLEGLEGEEGEIHVPPPPLDEDYWPCSGCHEPDDYDPERRTLTLAHKEIVLKHDEENRWCLDCHDAEDRDMLRLASGAKVPMKESYRLCGQCHGTIYRDWRAGIHGRRTGYWDGPKRYLLCVHCHWPHAPKFKPMKPLPPPVRPQYLQPGTEPQDLTAGQHEEVESGEKH